MNDEWSAMQFFEGMCLLLHCINMSQWDIGKKFDWLVDLFPLFVFCFLYVLCMFV